MGLTKVTNDLLDLGLDTSALGLPSGTTAQRPSNPVEGTLRHNSEIDETKLETFDGTDWRKINKPADTSPYAVDYLVIAGGGGGGHDHGGGGGAGGLRTSYGSTSGGGSLAETPVTLTFESVYTISIGSGGSGGASMSSGANSYFSGAGISTITSIGGGRGGTYPSPYAGSSGGSGGGAGMTVSQGGTELGGSGTTGQGYNGSNATQSGWNGYPSVGGGGAAQAGQTVVDSGTGGNGGNGLSVSITGAATYYAGGGGGCGEENGTTPSGGVGGLGGGGNGDYLYVDSAFPGTANTGGGGGGSRSQGSGGTGGGAGGSGVVILRMPTSRYSGTTTGSPIVTTDGTDTILTYTSSGTYTA